ncbi:MAG: lipocalin family protein [Aureispira sp.]|nr:lipocalin family protein [Aureispira sp.]
MLFYIQQPFHLELPKLEGTWHILATNFPMWLKGNRTQPTLNYSSTTHKGQKVLLDQVKFLKNGKPKTITGYDYFEDTSHTKFTWQGKGLLSLFKSRWHIALMSKNHEWAVIIFQKTLFTPAGIDIISKSPDLDARLLNKIIDLIVRKGWLKDSTDLPILSQSE